MIKKNKQRGFTMIELVVYIGITAMLLSVVASIVLNTINARKQLRASESIQHNARFMLNYMSNRLHNVIVVDDVNPAPEQIRFYNSTSTSFGFTVDSGNLLYWTSDYTAGAFPPLLNSTPQQINSGDATVSNFVLTATDDNFANPNRGINVSFILTTGNPSDSYAYSQQSFNTLISVR